MQLTLYLNSLVILVRIYYIYCIVSFLYWVLIIVTELTTLYFTADCSVIVYLACDKTLEFLKWTVCLLVEALLIFMLDMH